jgi:hypothetical protein
MPKATYITKLRKVVRALMSVIDDIQTEGCANTAPDNPTPVPGQAGTVASSEVTEVRGGLDPPGTEFADVQRRSSTKAVGKTVNAVGRRCSSVTSFPPHTGSPKNPANLAGSSKKKKEKPKNGAWNQGEQLARYEAFCGVYDRLAEKCNLPERPTTAKSVTSTQKSMYIRCLEFWRAKKPLPFEDEAALEAGVRGAISKGIECVDFPWLVRLDPHDTPNISKLIGWGKKPRVQASQGKPWAQVKREMAERERARAERDRCGEGE